MTARRYRYTLFVLSLCSLFLVGCDEDDSAATANSGQIQEIASEYENLDAETYGKMMEAQNQKLMQKMQEMMTRQKEPEPRDEVRAVKKISDEIYAISEDIAKLQLEQHKNMLATPGLTESRRRALQENLSLLRESIQHIQTIRPLLNALYAETEKTTPDLETMEDLQKKISSLSNKPMEIGLKVQSNLMIP
ncbi:MAG: hypothetical protein LBO79_07830 [Zoogloeaceae bacterium]|jgi:hypothetical protein|nr:hypothetical protein [Zoogloeaceae bacterium]